MTVTEFAKQIGESHQRVSYWLKRGYIKEAWKETDRHGEYWAIPESAVKTMANWKPSRGRPKGAKNKPKKKTKAA